MRYVEKIYQIKHSVSYFLLFLALKFRLYNICALILWFNIHKFKETIQTLEIRKSKILIFLKVVEMKI